MAPSRKEKQRTTELRRKEEMEEAEMVPIARGVTAGHLRRLRAVLIG